MEIREGLRNEWMEWKDALEAMRETRPTTDWGKSIQERALWFLELYENSRVEV